jgi:hypothetical protein
MGIISYRQRNDVIRNILPVPSKGMLNAAKSQSMKRAFGSIRISGFESRNHRWYDKRGPFLVPTDNQRQYVLERPRISQSIEGMLRSNIDVWTYGQIDNLKYERVLPPSSGWSDDHVMTGSFTLHCLQFLD